MAIDTGFNIGGSAESGNLETGGHFKYDFAAPLILNPCQHKIDRKGGGRIFNRKKIWNIIFHGDKDGFNHVTKYCTKLE